MHILILAASRMFPSTPIHPLKMQSSNAAHIPIHPAEDEVERPYRRHRSARYLVHRVKESLTTRVSKMICTVVLFIIFIAGLIFFLLYLSLKPHRPRFYVDDFQISGFDQPNGFQNAGVTYNVTIRNSDRKIIVDFDSVYGTVYYRDQIIGGASMSTDPFIMQPKTSKTLNGVLSGGVTMAVGSIGWGEFLNDRTVGRVVFKLDIKSVIKFEVYSWGSKNHKMHASCNVGVGPNGFILDTYKHQRCPVYFT